MWHFIFRDPPGSPRIPLDTVPLDTALNGGLSVIRFPLDTVRFSLDTVPPGYGAKRRIERR